MKKIMFNDKYGLTDAVLGGRKTMTRRVIKGDYVKIVHLEHEGSFIGKTANGDSVILPQPAYNVGEEVAVAQSYSNLREVLAKRNFKRTDTLYDKFYRAMQMGEAHDGMPGWSNKMFVRADLMPHRIRITDIKVERLQNISEEDCLREGIYKHNALPDALGEDRYKFISYAYDATQDKHRKRKWFPTPREAFAALIDKVVEFDHFRKSAGLKVCKRGTWDSNPWVWAYTFEVIK